MPEREFYFMVWGADGQQKHLTPVRWAEFPLTAVGKALLDTFTAAVADDLCRPIRLDYEADPSTNQARPSIDIYWRPLTPTSAVGTLKRDEGIQMLAVFLAGIDRKSEDEPTIGAMEKMVAEHLPAYPSAPFEPLRWENSARPVVNVVSFGEKPSDAQSMNALAALGAAYFRRKGVA